MRKLMRKLGQFTGLFTAVLLLTALLMSRGLFLGVQGSLQNQFYDDDRPGDDIVIVAIDEKSLQALGPFSGWTREHYAWAIGALERAGVKAVGVDVTFPDADAGDDALARVLGQYKNIVLAGRYFFENGRRMAELPNAALLSQEPAVGWINVNLDADGFVRQLPPRAAAADGKTLDAFSVAVARLAGDVPAIPTVTRRDGKTGEEVELMLINYAAAPDAFHRVSLTDIMNETPVNQRGERLNLEGKIALIGPTAADLQDQYLSPVGDGRKMPGVEIHANAIQMIREGRFLRHQSAAALWITLFLIAAINTALFSFLKLRYAIPLAILELTGITVAGVAAYEWGVLLNVVYPVFTALTSFVGAYLIRFLSEQKQRRFIEGAFGHYVNAEVVEAIIAHPETLHLGGAKCTITTFFSDIAGFTTLSEKMKPEDLVAFLNEYLQAMTGIILEHKGTLDKYEGDAIMAFWNAPLAQPDHARQACRAALEQQKKLADLRREWATRGLPEIQVRMGLNTGEAVVGNMGSADRFDYTAIGDNVNLASRLEGINKQYGTAILVSRETYLATKDDFSFREIDAIRVKGKKEPVHIYELGRESAGYAEALALYRDRRFAEAEKKFADLNNDPAADVFAKRCAAFIKNPPAPDWDGVWNFEVK